MIEAIEPFLAPAVMISAGALLCIAQSSRYNLVVVQLRELHREILATLRKANDSDPEQLELLRRRAEGLEFQSKKVLTHAVMVRNALRFIVGGIGLMVLCSLSVGASMVFAAFSVVALALFVLGLVSTLVGLFLVLSELRVSLEGIEFEHDNLSRLRRGKGLLPPEH